MLKEENIKTIMLIITMFIIIIIIKGEIIIEDIKTTKILEIFPDKIIFIKTRIRILFKVFLNSINSSK